MKDNPRINQLLKEAWSKRGEKKYDEARALVEQAHGLCKDDDYNSLGRVFHVYMQFESDHNNHSKAIALCERSLMYYKTANNLDGIAHSTRHIADLQYHLGQESDSEHNYREAIGIYRINPEKHIGNFANALRGLALLLERREKKQEAIKVWEETKELYNFIHLQEGVDEANNKLNSLL